MISLLIQIVQSSPPIAILDMSYFCNDINVKENMGELVLEALLSSNIDTITDLNLRSNKFWFKHPDTHEER